MDLKILLINQRQVEWAKKLDQNILKKYGQAEIVPMNEKVKISRKDAAFFENAGIHASSYRNFGIEGSIRQSLSPVPVNVIKKMLSETVEIKRIKDIVCYRGVDMLSATGNDMYENYYWEFMLFTQRLSFLIAHEGPFEILVFGPKNISFSAPERPDVTSLFDNEFLYAPLAKEVCDRLNVKFIIAPQPIFLLSGIKIGIRHLLFASIKFLKIFWRHFLVRLPLYKKANIENDDRKLIAMIVRADPEYYAAKPLVDQIKNELDMKTVILQSDMLLQPQSWKTLRAREEEFISMYSLSSISKYFICFASGLFRQLKFARAMRNLKLEEFNPGHSENEKLCADFLDKDYFIKEVFKGTSGVWPETMVFIEELEYFIARYKPKAFISMGMIDHWVAVTSMLSNRHSIPTVSIQTTAMETHALPSPIYANKFLVYGNDMRNGLIGCGASPEKVLATGAPKYDHYRQCNLEEEKRIRSEIRRKLGIPENVKILLVTTQATDYTSKPLNDELIRLALEFAKSHPDIYVIVKLHPRDPIEDYLPWQNRMKQENANAQVIQRMDVIDLMMISKVLLSRCSTTILDALVLDVMPVVLLDSYALSWMAELDYLRTEATTKTESPHEIISIFKRAFYENSFAAEFENKRRIFLESSIGQVDGQAGKRMIDIIRSLVAEKQ